MESKSKIVESAAEENLVYAPMESASRAAESVVDHHFAFMTRRSCIAKSVEDQISVSMAFENEDVRLVEDVRFAATISICVIARNVGDHRSVSTARTNPAAKNAVDLRSAIMTRLNGSARNVGAMICAGTVW